MERPQSPSAPRSDKTPASASGPGAEQGAGPGAPASSSFWAIVVGGGILALAGYLVFGTGPGAAERRDDGAEATAPEVGGASSEPKARRTDAAMKGRASSPAVQRATTELASAAGGGKLPGGPHGTGEGGTDALVTKLESFEKRLTELEASLAKHDAEKAKFVGTYDDAAEGEKKWQSQRDTFEKSIASTKKQIAALEAKLGAE